MNIKKIKERSVNHYGEHLRANELIPGDAPADPPSPTEGPPGTHPCPAAPPDASPPRRWVCPLAAGVSSTGPGNPRRWGWPGPQNAGSLETLCPFPPFVLCIAAPFCFHCAAKLRSWCLRRKRTQWPSFDLKLPVTTKRERRRKRGLCPLMEVWKSGSKGDWSVSCTH